MWAQFTVRTQPQLSIIIDKNKEAILVCKKKHKYMTFGNSNLL